MDRSSRARRCRLGTQVEGGLGAVVVVERAGEEGVQAGAFKALFVEEAFGEAVERVAMAFELVR